MRTAHTDPDNRRLMALFAAQMSEPDSPESVREVPEEDAWTIAGTLVQVARLAGWTPSPRA